MRDCKKARWTSVIALMLMMVSLSGCGGKVNIDLTASISASSMGSTELLSNRYTKPEPKGKKEIGLSLDGFERVLENESFAVYLRREIGGIRLVDKKSGYVWGSLAEDKPNNLNRKWATLANSLIAIDVYDENGSLNSVGAGGGEINFSVKDNTLMANVHWKEQNIRLAFTMQLTDYGLSFHLNDKSIEENGTYQLGAIYFAPYFGSTEGNTRQGYMFVPDGCGALIRFTNPRSYLQGFSKKVYGSDLGIDSLTVINDLGANRINAFSTDEEAVSVPAFGIVQGSQQNAFFAVIEQGDNYAVIQADPAGITTDYNRAYARFVYRQKYEQPVSRKGAGVQMVQKERNTVNPIVSYRFLSGDDADYVGMAKTYRQMLIEEDVLEKRDAKQSDIPLKLDFLVADVQKEFFGTSIKKASELDAIENAIENILEQDISNIQVALLGWQKGGLNGYSKSDSSEKSAYGEVSVFDSLKKKLESKGGSLRLTLSPLSAKKGQLDLRSEAAISLSQTMIIVEAEDKNQYLGDRYFLKPQTGSDILRKQTKVLGKSGYNQWVIGDIGYLLYGEYLENRVMKREEVRELFKQTATDLMQQYGKLHLIRPNSYLFAQTGCYLDTPMVSSQYLFETDTVPFLQIVLSGYMELFSPYVNLSFYSRADILKQIDYNTYPAFLLTEKSNYDLRKSASAQIQSSRIGDWQEYIQDTYQMMNAILSNTRGQAITGRKVVETGLVKVIYESGMVYINYNATPKMTDGLAIPAESAIYAKG
ncbi:MAG: DUF5696 domain-containing protein [Oscillospiraceae bacterium]|nr:DUF5696 domain-containing protein [Oscillospiraceae bacterium]